MKLRNGFVSNSSSASFIVTVDLTFDKICQGLQCSSLFNYYDIVRQFETALKESDINIKEYKEKLKGKKEGDGIYKLWLGPAEDHSKKLREYINKANKLKDTNTDEIIHMFLEYRSINISKSLNGQQTLFHGWTTMWNGIEDIGETLQQIIVCMAINNVRVSLQVNNEG